MTNQQLRNYKIIKQLGEGGMATVYLAEHIDLGHMVAIKILNKEFSFNQNIRNRFIDEAKKMVRMDHPNVVKVTDLINDSDTVAIVMEYVNGETLKDVLSRKKLTDSEIEDYLKQMALALDYVHSQGLVHRDIKPSNFIFNEKGILKLTDFGISKSVEGDLDGHTQTSTAMSMGTPMYMSPEQVRSTKDVTYLSDIYSLGVVLWEMAAGKKPYDLSSLSAFDLQLRIVQEDLPLTNTHWDIIIQRASQKEEFNRFKCAQDFLLDLNCEAIIKDDFESTILTEKVNSPQKVDLLKSNHLQKKERKKKILFFSIGSASVLITIFLISFLFKNKDSGSQNEARMEIEKENTEKENHTLKLQNQLDSLRLIDEIRAKDSLKSVLVAKEQKQKEDLNKKEILTSNHPGRESIKIGNLEVKTKDIGEMNIYDALEASEKLGNRWRLPTKSEMNILYLNKSKIGGFTLGKYWTCSEYEGLGGDLPGGNFAFSFDDGKTYFGGRNSNLYRVRVVRNL